MGETGWKDEQIFSKQQESLWMEGTTRAEPGGQRCVQAGVDSREHGGMVRGPRSRLPTFLSTCLLSPGPMCALEFVPPCPLPSSPFTKKIRPELYFPGPLNLE